MNYKEIIESCEENKKEYLKYEKFPHSVILEVTNFCNLSCKFCGQSCMTREKGFMTVELFKKCVDEVALKSPESEVWLIFYGEPLILKYKLVYLIQYAKKKGLKNVYLNTNGLLLDKELSEALIDSGLDRIVFSLDAYYEESYKKIRNNDKFEYVKKSILEFLELKRKMNSKIKTEVQLIEIPGIHIEGEKELFIKYWKEKGANLKIKPPVTWNGAVEIDQKITQKRIPCSMLFKICVVTWTGEVAQCAADYNRKFIAGNINQESIESVWKGKLKQLREKHIEEKYSEVELCKECQDWNCYVKMPFFEEIVEKKGELI